MGYQDYERALHKQMRHEAWVRAQQQGMAGLGQTLLGQQAPKPKEESNKLLLLLENEE